MSACAVISAAGELAWYPLQATAEVEALVSGEYAPGAIDTGLANSELPSVRRIRLEMHVGQPRAQAIRDYLSVLTRR